MDGKVHCETTGRDYTPRAWELSKRIYRYLAATRNVVKHGTLTYKELGEAMDVHHRTLKDALGVIQDHCRVRGWHTITVFVVRKGSGLPSTGCDFQEVDEVEKAFAGVRKIDWPKEPWW